jgi:hypothetical protein
MKFKINKKLNFNYSSSRKLFKTFKVMQSFSSKLKNDFFLLIGFLKLQLNAQNYLLHFPGLKTSLCSTKMCFSELTFHASLENAIKNSLKN